MMKKISVSKNPLGGGVLLAALAAACAGVPRATAWEAAGELLERPDGRRLQGRIAGSSASGFSFIPTDGSSSVPLEAGSIIHCDGSEPDPLASPPLFRVLAGEALRLSGSLRSISSTTVLLGVRWQGAEISLSRPGVQVVLQRPGMARVLVDNFESLESSHWKTSGKVLLVQEPHVSERKSLQIPAGGASLARTLDEPLPAGRLELAYHDDGSVVPGLRWSIDLTFKGPNETSVLRVIPGWADESLAVEMPGFPALAVQPLARTPGWHRFVFRFSPENTEISVDGKDLAHGKTPEGQLVSIGIASSSPAALAPPPERSKTPVCHIDDLQLTRFAEPSVNVELDIKQDEARLVVGDQLFGEVQKADSEQVLMSVEGKKISLPWGQISGVYFRRMSASGTPVHGLLARVRWRSAAGPDPANLDLCEGAIIAASDRAITVATPFSGVFSIPRQLIHTIQILGFGRWYLIDATAHHLGDEVSITAPVLDPPEPEGAVLERSIDLPELPAGSWFLVLDVVQVVGEDGDPLYSERVKNGEFRTYALVNGRRIDYVNRHIKTDNATPERVKMAIPGGVLHPGKNTIRLELTGAADRNAQLDDLGVLQMALEHADAGSPRAGNGPPAARP
jgi:hypothetical protein